MFNYSASKDMKLITIIYVKIKFVYILWKERYNSYTLSITYLKQGKFIIIFTTLYIILKPLKK